MSTCSSPCGCCSRGGALGKHNFPPRAHPKAGRATLITPGWRPGAAFAAGLIAPIRTRPAATTTTGTILPISSPSPAFGRRAFAVMRNLTSAPIVDQGRRSRVPAFGRPAERRRGPAAPDEAWRGNALNVVGAADFENQRNESSGLAGGAGAAGHLANATREFKQDDLVDVIDDSSFAD
jgi:hypothetical protein